MSADDHCLYFSTTTLYPTAMILRQVYNIAMECIPQLTNAVTDRFIDSWHILSLLSAVSS